MNDSDHAELTLQEYVGVLRGWRIPILLLLVLATSGAAVAAYVLPKKYTATVLISPVTNSGSSGLLSGLNSMVSQIGGLASLAGVSQTSDSTKAESLATLESEGLTDAYIEQNNLLPVIFRSKWDSRRGVWIDQDARHIPTLWQANQYFKKRVRDVTADAKTGLVTLKITWTDPATAAKWANDLVRMTNQYRRDKAIQESERNVSFLTAEAAKTDVVGVKQAIYSILQNEISKMMLARGNEEYALKVIDPATPPERPSSPLPLYWTVGAFFMTLGLCMMAAFLRATIGHRTQIRDTAG